MAEINHFEYGWITPTLGYALSVLGSFLGLLCAIRAREAPSGGQRSWYLILAAWAIGGTAIWSMHFMAMLGFGVAGSQIRYDAGLTAASALIAIAAVGIGLFVVGFGRAAAPRMLLAGLITGAGVAAMHYTGMAAMRVHGSISYAVVPVVASVAIAVVAATAALWLAITVRGTLAIVTAAPVMGVAVTGMHYTAMAAMSVHRHAPGGSLHGATESALLVPIVLMVILVVIGLIYAVLAAPTEEDRAGAAYLNARIASRAT